MWMYNYVDVYYVDVYYVHVYYVYVYMHVYMYVNVYSVFLPIVRSHTP